MGKKHPSSGCGKIIGMFKKMAEKNQKNKYSKSARTSSRNTSVLSSTDNLIARLKEKLNRAKAVKPKAQSHLTGNNFATKSSRRIQVGWFNCSSSDKLGRKVAEVVAGNCDMSTILTYVFFLNGKSDKG